MSGLVEADEDTHDGLGEAETGLSRLPRKKIVDPVVFDTYAYAVMSV